MMPPGLILGLREETETAFHCCIRKELKPQMILVANTLFNELNELAAGLAEAGLLSEYVRPYANLQRGWEQSLANFSRLRKFYAHTIARRKMPKSLNSTYIHEAGLIMDFAAAAHARLPASTLAYKTLQRMLVDARTKAVAVAAAKALTDERAVVASFGCAEPVFRRAKVRGGLCVLNYPIAHHSFGKRYLFEEAKRQPDFASTITGHDYPAWLEQRLNAEIELADYILVGSSFVRDSFVTEGVQPKKLVVIPYGVDTQFFKPIAPNYPSSSDLRLLFVGQIGQRKGISYLLEAAKKISEDGVSLTLIGKIQGDGKALEPYKYFFRHIPYLPRSELSEFYRQANVFVFPTLIEGMALVVLEGMASGLAVITTPNGLGDIVRDGVDGFLIPPRDVDAIVDRVKYLKNRPELCKKMGNNARERALEYTWNAYRQAAVSQLKVWLNNK
jgi:glycosyltransferase involved in cell wall biosynthesis